MSHDPMSGTHDCGGDAAAYVLGALEAGEVDSFRKHLDTCAFCRDEIAVLQQAADALPMAAPSQPVPRGLRRRVLAEVHADARAAERARSRQRSRQTFSWLPRPALAGGALAALALAAFGGVELASSGSSSGARVISASVGNAQLRVAAGHAELIVHGLPQAPPGRIYEVWLRHGNQAPTRTRALFGVTSAGDADVDVPGSLHGVSTVLVTQERAGGSPHPTSPPVVVARIT
jgi:anti-sigma-K factor RskA